MIMKKLYDDLVSSNPKSKVKKDRKKDRKEKSSKRDKKKRSESGEKSKRNRSKNDDSRSRSRSVDFDSDTEVTFPNLKNYPRDTSRAGNPQNTKVMLPKTSTNPPRKVLKRKKNSESGQKARSPRPKNPLTLQTPTQKLLRPKKIYYSMITSGNGLVHWFILTKKAISWNFW